MCHHPAARLCTCTGSSQICGCVQRPAGCTNRPIPTVLSLVWFHARLCLQQRISLLTAVLQSTAIDAGIISNLLGNISDPLCWFAKPRPQRQYRPTESQWVCTKTVSILCFGGMLARSTSTSSVATTLVRYCVAQRLLTKTLSSHRQYVCH